MKAMALCPTAVGAILETLEGVTPRLNVQMKWFHPNHEESDFHFDRTE